MCRSAAAVRFMILQGTPTLVAFFEMTTTTLNKTESFKWGKTMLELGCFEKFEITCFKFQKYDFKYCLCPIKGYSLIF